MIYSKNYDKKEIKKGLDASREDLPVSWSDNDNIKVLGTEEYPIDKGYKLIN